ncbi:hypothetical protein LCGC14_2017400 [marine sediment metagenome]|uniref:Tyrosine specific protein phosphatases domain-containing protein n=1 Tax=marine sediment metagenome TaxID=412755 RepID=A0A0F9FL10_9ZZZZ
MGPKMNVMANDAYPETTSIRARIPMESGGRLVMAGFPGLEIGVDGSAYIDAETLEATMSAMVSLGTKTLLVMAEEGELPDGAFGFLKTAADRHAVRLEFMPIQDFSTPGDRFLEAWSSLGPQLHHRLANDEAVGLSCQYGAGRSGLVASLILIEAGMTPVAAIRRVRSHFSQAVESKGQEDWLINLGQA